MIKPQVVSPKMLVEYTGGCISIAGAYRLAAAGELPRFKLGKRTVFRTADVDAFLEKRLIEMPEGDPRFTGKNKSVAGPVASETAQAGRNRQQPQ